MTTDAPTGSRLRRWYATSLVGHPDGRDFRQLWIGDTISQLGTQVGGIALPLLAVSVLAADEFQMGLLATFENIAFLLIGLPAGAWVDRMSKRQVLIWGDVVRGLALLSLPVAWLLGVLSFPLVLVVATVVGVATVFFDVAYQSYLPSLVPSERISEGNAKLQISASVAQVAGPGLGGVLVRLLGAPLVLLIDAISFLGSVVFTLRIRHREEPRGARTVARSTSRSGRGWASCCGSPCSDASWPRRPSATCSTPWEARCWCSTRSATWGSARPGWGSRSASGPSAGWSGRWRPDP